MKRTGNLAIIVIEFRWNFLFCSNHAGVDPVYDRSIGKTTRKVAQSAKESKEIVGKVII